MTGDGRESVAKRNKDAVTYRSHDKIDWDGCYRCHRVRGLAKNSTIMKKSRQRKTVFRGVFISLFPMKLKFILADHWDQTISRLNIYCYICQLSEDHRDCLRSRIVEAFAWESTVGFKWSRNLCPECIATYQLDFRDLMCFPHLRIRRIKEKES